MSKRLSVFKPSSTHLSGFGHYLPAEIVSNEQLIAESGLEISSDWIKKRIGVSSRHRVAEGENTSDMALQASLMALASAGLKASDLDAIILSTISPDHPNPATACALQAKLGIGDSRIPCFDISAACSGFLYALDVGSRYIETEMERVLVVSSEVRSRFINPKDPSTFPIFGDGAAAVVLENSGSAPLSGLKMMADGQGYYSVHIPAGGSVLPASLETVNHSQHFITMNDGQKIFFKVVEGMSAYAQSFLEACGYGLDEVDFVIAHQANLNILKEVQRRLGLPKEKMLINIQSTGNTSSASIPLVLSQKWHQGEIPKGSRVLCVSAGAGHTMGLALFQV